MSLIKDWKFEVGGMTITEDTTFTDEVRNIAKDLSLPENNLSLAKIHVLQTGFPVCKFFWLGITIELSTDKILSFNPFFRAQGEGQGAESLQQAWYQLGGQEYCLTPLKKNLI